MPRARLSPRVARAALLAASLAAASTLGACGEKQEPDLSTVPEPVETVTTPTEPAPTASAPSAEQPPGRVATGPQRGPK